MLTSYKVFVAIENWALKMNSQVRFCSILLVAIDYTNNRVTSKETQKSRCGDKSKHENQYICSRTRSLVLDTDTLRTSTEVFFKETQLKKVLHRDCFQKLSVTIIIVWSSFPLLPS